MAGSARTESVRRLVELTGLGIAATYFLDPNHGAERRRAVLRWAAGARHDPRATVSPVAAMPPVAEAHPAITEPDVPEPAPAGAETAPMPEPEPSELVLLAADEPSGGAGAEGGYWPAWGWPLVLTITICAVAAFAAVGLGIWAIEHRTPTTRTVVVRDVRAASVLADPTAARVIGSATRGSVLLRLDSRGAALAVDGLPPLAAGERYRVWVTVGGSERAVGSFAAPRAILPMKPLASGSRVTITREAAGAGPDAPHGPQVASVAVAP